MLAKDKVSPLSFDLATVQWQLRLLPSYRKFHLTFARVFGDRRSFIRASLHFLKMNSKAMRFANNDSKTIVLTVLFALLASPSSSASSPASSYDTSMVDRLLSDREVLIQDGLSYFNDTTLKV